MEKTKFLDKQISYFEISKMCINLTYLHFLFWHKKSYFSGCQYEISLWLAASAHFVYLPEKSVVHRQLRWITSFCLMQYCSGKKLW